MRVIFHDVSLVIKRKLLVTRLIQLCYVLMLENFAAWRKTQPTLFSLFFIKHITSLKSYLLRQLCCFYRQYKEK